MNDTANMYVLSRKSSSYSKAYCNGVRFSLHYRAIADSFFTSDLPLLMLDPSNLGEAVRDMNSEDCPEGRPQ